MSRWVRSPVLTICGKCSGQIDVGVPMLVLELPGVKAKGGQKVRCVTCDGPAPADLPPLVERVEPMRVFTKLGQLLPLDFKMRQIGEEG